MNEGSGGYLIPERFIPILKRMDEQIAQGAMVDVPYIELDLKVDLNTGMTIEHHCSGGSFQIHARDIPEVMFF